jgi:hypothetical protein
MQKQGGGGQEGQELKPKPGRPARPTQREVLMKNEDTPGVALIGRPPLSACHAPQVDQLHMRRRDRRDRHRLPDPLRRHAYMALRLLGWHRRGLTLG